MTWFRVDDKFHDHRKVRLLGKDRLPAVGLWTLCGDWCADNTTDGFIPAEVVRRHDPRLRYAKRLVEVVLWHEVEREGEVGFEFHQWFEHQPSREQVEEKRRKTREKVAAWRKRRAAQEPVAPEDDGAGNQGCNPVTNQVSHQVSNPAPDPTRPDPSTSPNGEVPPSLRSGDARERKTTKKATRIPDDFAPTEAMIAWARDNTPNVGRAATEDFIDYWQAKSGKDATKVDWVATWRRWMREQQRRFEERQTRSSPQPNGNRPATGSKRMDKALAALAPDDPFLAQYAAAAQQATSGPNGLLVIEGGRTT